RASNLEAAHVAVGDEASLLDAATQGPQIAEVAEVPAPRRDRRPRAPPAPREHARHEVDNGHQLGVRARGLRADGRDLRTISR
ncbi:MAG: hypothetical protein ACJ72I_13115, partial [Pseudonocardiaceae bacterium]